MPAPRHLEQAARALRDGASLRAVVRARIGAASPDDVHRTRFALEDALATADFGDCGRLVVIRALSLGRLPAGASGATVARAVEQAWRSVAGRAVAFSAPGAAEAPAVYFASLAAARTAYVCTVVHGATAAAWFWPRVLPELAGASSPGDAVVRVLLAVAPDTASVLADDVVRWEAHALSALEALLPASPPAAVQVALDRLVLDEESGTPQTERGRPAPVGARTRERRVSVAQEVEAAAAVLRARGRCMAVSPSDWRGTWVSGLLLRGTLGRPLTRVVVEHAMAAAAVRTPLPANDGVRDVQTDGPAEPQARTTSSHVMEERSVPGERREAPPMAATPSPDLPPSGTSAPGAPAATSGSLSERPHTGVKTRLRAQVPWLADGRPTDWAGLPMLLTVLEALGVERWIAAQRDEVAVVFARVWLSALADRLRVSTTDGIRAALATTAGERDALERCRTDWTHFAWPAWCSAPLPRRRWTSTSQALVVWRVASRRALQRHAGIGIVALCRRPGVVTTTATHVDVTLPLDAADLRIRRHGLDRDPGWVPWFGRIVAFHYAGQEILARETDGV